MDASPEAGEWVRFASLPVAGGRVAVSDPMFFRDRPPPPSLELPPGQYEVAALLWTGDGDTRVAGLRVSDGRPGGERAELVGEVGVDFAQVGVFDPAVLEAAVAAMTPEQERATFDGFDTLELWGTAHFGGDGHAVMPFVRSGFGDGVYPVFPLHRDGAVVGLEVVFIGPGAGVESVRRRG